MIQNLENVKVTISEGALVAVLTLEPGGGERAGTLLLLRMMDRALPRPQGLGLVPLVATKSARPTAPARAEPRRAADDAPPLSNREPASTASPLARTSRRRFVCSSSGCLRMSATVPAALPSWSMAAAPALAPAAMEAALALRTS
ncbi:unnamed protein product [Prorocentrum cordatum]|uniref:Uncharacterized protein n=1 Tax=Prorocentrum cordatum TaxID=2364126 RepID=A0ABN9USU6_9DINO|nr:unnamed protein product [Polarella glacialis]